MKMHDFERWDRMRSAYLIIYARRIIRHSCDENEVHTLRDCTTEEDQSFMNDAQKLVLYLSLKCPPPIKLIGQNSIIFISTGHE